MKSPDLKSMSVDDLWALHVEISEVLTRRMAAEKTQLERRLEQLKSNKMEETGVRPQRRPYPEVVPKYRNPADPSETWAGRGKQPRWLTAQLKGGKKLDDFRIQNPNDRARRAGRR
jgi:DNA-binding protein H-NS